MLKAKGKRKRPADTKRRSATTSRSSSATTLTGQFDPPAPPPPLMGRSPLETLAARVASSSTTTSVADLVPDPTNRRHHPARNVAMLVDALTKVGAARSIVIDEHNGVLAGNGVLEAAAAAGITKLQVVDADGATIIAVRRSGLSDAQKRELAMFDNRTGELAEWDLPQLAADLAAGEDMAPFFFDDELHRILKTGATQTATAAVLGALEYRVIVDCETEQAQADLLIKLEGEGFTCRALIS